MHAGMLVGACCTRDAGRWWGWRGRRGRGAKGQVEFEGDINKLELLYCMDGSNVKVVISPHG